MKDVTIDASCYREGRIFGTTCNIWTTFLSTFPSLTPAQCSSSIHLHPPLVHASTRYPIWFHQTRPGIKTKEKQEKTISRPVAGLHFPVLLCSVSFANLSIRHGVCSCMSFLFFPPIFVSISMHYLPRAFCAVLFACFLSITVTCICLTHSE